MKKFIALLLTLAIVMAFAACTKTEPTTTAKPDPKPTTTVKPAPTTTVPATPEFDPATKSEGVMT
ncbi:MAG: hypothetical protein IKY59_04630, partial [Oscillospiraceae bacterium]|nr:hypothetical protein [Oscillospiraceae bacterium]